MPLKWLKTLILSQKSGKNSLTLFDSLQSCPQTANATNLFYYILCQNTSKILIEINPAL